MDHAKMREAVRFIHKMGSVPDDEVRKMISDLSDEGLRQEDERKQQRSRLLFDVLRRLVILQLQQKEHSRLWI